MKLRFKGPISTKIFKTNGNEPRDIVKISLNEKAIKNTPYKHSDRLRKVGRQCGSKNKFVRP